MFFPSDLYIADMANLVPWMVLRSLRVKLMLTKRLFYAALLSEACFRKNLRICLVKFIAVFLYQVINVIPF